MGRFAESLERVRSSGRAPIICDIKLRSPAEGDLLAGRDPVELARAMEAGGAACLSVVTEPEHFGGSIALLCDICEATSLPVLRKDFVTTPEDVHATRDAGASCLLLIVSMLQDALLDELHREARACGLETLVEAHTAGEVRRALQLGPDLLGINNRDITRLEVDGGTPANTLQLVSQAPPGVRVISESGISGAADVRAVIRAGALGALVGTAVLSAADTEAFVRELAGALQDGG